ncbi:MAG: cytidylate kinase-like family protein [Ignavibacteriaceae bacterium]|nr:cytidylate kinase-like family protein [Ignavibacteriaceae bacterium]
MTQIGSYEKAKRYFESSARLYDQDNRTFRGGPCITISRQTGSGSGKISSIIVEKLSREYTDKNYPWTVFDKNLIDEVIAAYNLPPKLKEYLQEKTFPALQTMMNEMFGLHPSLVELKHKTSECIMHIAQIGYCIIIGRGANYVTSHLKNSMSIRLIAPLEKRIKHFMDNYGYDHKQAAEIIRQSDAEKKKYFQTYFNKDSEDPIFYDLTINTGKLNYEESADQIIAFIKHRFKDL